MVPIPSGGGATGRIQPQAQGPRVARRTFPPFLYAVFRDILRNLEKKLSMGVISAVSQPLEVLSAGAYAGLTVGSQTVYCRSGPL